MIPTTVVPGNTLDPSVLEWSSVIVSGRIPSLAYSEPKFVPRFALHIFTEDSLLLCSNNHAWISRLLRGAPREKSKYQKEHNQQTWNLSLCTFVIRISSAVSRARVSSFKSELGNRLPGLFKSIRVYKYRGVPRMRRLSGLVRHGFVIPAHATYCVDGLKDSRMITQRFSFSVALKRSCGAAMVEVSPLHQHSRKMLVPSCLFMIPIRLMRRTQFRDPLAPHWPLDYPQFLRRQRIPIPLLRCLWILSKPEITHFNLEASRCKQPLGRAAFFSKDLLPWRESAHHLVIEDDIFKDLKC